MREDIVPVGHQGSSTSLLMLASLLLVIGSACLAPTVGAQTYTIIHNFTNGADGPTPQAGLTMDAGGNFCGTTSFGGFTGKLTRFSSVGAGPSLMPLRQKTPRIKGVFRPLETLATARVIPGHGRALWSRFWS